MLIELRYPLQFWPLIFVLNSPTVEDMAPRRGARQQSVPDSGHRGSPSGPDAQESTAIPESQVSHMLPVCSTENSVCSTENSVTAQDTMPTLQASTAPWGRRTFCDCWRADVKNCQASKMTWIPSFFYRVASSKSCVANAQAQKDAVTATLIESN